MNDGTSSLEPQYEEFTAWVKQQGVKVNGVMPAKLPERGIGIVAQRHIEVSGTYRQYMFAPAERTFRSVRNSFVCPLLLS